MKSLSLLTFLFYAALCGVVGCTSVGMKPPDVNVHQTNEANLAVAEICETDQVIHRFYRRSDSEPIAAVATYNKETRRDIGFFSIEKSGSAFLDAARKDADCGPPKLTAKAAGTKTAVR